MSPYIDMRRHGSRHKLRRLSASLFAAAAVAANCIDRRDMVHTASKQLKLLQVRICLPMLEESRWKWLTLHPVTET